MTLGLTTYKALTGAISPVLPILLRQRVKKGKEDENRLQEREGFPSKRRPEGPLIWMHGASIGESQVLLLLFDALKAEAPGLQAVITTQTITSAELIARKSPDGLIHQMAPIDTPFATERFLKHWQPDLAIFAEGDIWPNMLTKLDKKSVPRLLVNARMTEKSFNGWMRFQTLAKTLFGGFAAIYAANQKTGDWLKRFTRNRARFTGNIKHAAPALFADDAELSSLNAKIGRRNVIAAISTHPGEEELVKAAIDRLSERLPERPLLILAPRHPERGPDIAALFGSDHGPVYLRSRNEEPNGDENTWICDTLGEIGLWMRLSDVVFIGGGLEGIGIHGHNPIEALKLERHVISFPDVSNFKQEFADMVAAEAASLVTGADELADALYPRLVEGTLPAPDMKKLTAYFSADKALNTARDKALHLLKAKLGR